MPADPRTWLHDLLSAGSMARQFTDGQTFEQYAADAMRVSAVERQLGSVGEAATPLLRQVPDAPLTDARSIVGFRNILIHNYARVSQAVVWTILYDHLPVLLDEARRWLDALNEEGRA